MRSRNGRLHEHAAVTIRNLAMNAENEKVMSEEGAIMIVVREMMMRDDDRHFRHFSL